jgi:SAM-dependent MidA family methyltransferase
MQQRFELPRPTADALAHSRELARLIAARIGAAGGWIDFAEYMDLALYAPGLGYYSAGATKLGPSGDFVTAPEISPLFGRCVANACMPWLRANPQAVILEIGAGTGALAAELLAAFERSGTPVSCYLVLEVSADLRERQRATLAARVPRLQPVVQWLDALPEAPITALVIANEVADALPVSRFTKRDGVVLAQGVAVIDGHCGWATRPASATLAGAVAEIEAELGCALPDGYTSEVSLRLPAWVSAVAATLERGVLLACDYGLSRPEYYHPDRRDGTLICHYRHRAHADPFFHPGLQDITAWLDFSALALAGKAARLQVAGYATQAHFLVDAGLDRELAALMTGDSRADLDLARQAKMLLLPGEMGERFKIMALARGDERIGGFGYRDLRRML